MGVSWTKEQQKVIDTRGRNLLVSAAAGSGKTAVLVERILTMVTDPVHPVDIDRLLVVTFTNAAAAEMRSRIGAALEKRLEEHPEDGHLRRQTALIHHAKIMTIHSFCTYVLRNYFGRIALDPDFRIGEEGELKLLRGDVLKQLREDAYGAEDPAFRRFVECYALGKSDGGLEDYIEGLYQFAMSDPFPEKLLKSWSADFAAESGEESLWMQELLADVRRQVGELEEQCRFGIELCREEGGPYIYEPMLADDLDHVLSLKAARDYEAVYRCLENLTFQPMSRKRPKDIDPLQKEKVSALRGHIKKTLQSLQKAYGRITLAQAVEEDALCREPMEVLVRLTLDFKQRYEAVKRDKNIVDFDDLEHLALEILVEETAEGYARTDVARELSESFEEILIDEYQDSNLLQETLLTAVSGLKEERFNIFRVGDVKQSIYRFRLARPELFMEKYHTYPVGEAAEKSPCQRIDLHKNFRSRPEVLDSVNRVFAQIMGASLGGIEYDAEAALYPGRKCLETTGFETELWLITPEDEEVAAELSKKELEARMVAAQIKEMTRPGNHFLKSEENPEGADLQYKDVAILLRTYNGWAEIFAEALNAEGIPVFVQSKTGYFDTPEVATALNFLRIIDNPRQDIPLAAVLKSPIAGVTTGELADMVVGYRGSLKETGEKGSEAAGKQARSEAELYEAFLWYEEQGEDPALREKLARFGRMWRRFRELSRVKSTYELLDVLLTESRYELFAAAMPGGEARSANLDMLKQKALDYETTSFHGLFDFIRYIESLQKYEMDFGGASVVGENENAVRIYSIHKSKGLEFPVCFVSGLDKPFNHGDTRRRILVHADLGLAADVIDPKLRTKRASLRKKTFVNRMLADELGEELRVLYVAMTRAREKLILTASSPNLEKATESRKELEELPGNRVPYTFLSKANCYLDWLMMARSRDPEVFRFRVLTLGDALIHQLEKTQERIRKRAQFEDPLAWPLTEEECAELEARLHYTYPFEKAVTMCRKVSVSDLKRQDQENEEGRNLFEESPAEKQGEGEVTGTELTGEKQPEKETTGELTGSDRGNAYHRFLDLLSLQTAAQTGGLAAERRRLKASGRMTDRELDCIRDKDIRTFLQSPLGVRMLRAEEAGLLCKERRFVLGVSSAELNLDLGSEETLLIQGIMDACFREGEDWILVDYKTDWVPYEGGEEELIRRYRTQLLTYRRALAQMTGRKVAETWIYSFGLGRGFRLEE